MADPATPWADDPVVTPPAASAASDPAAPWANDPVVAPPPDMTDGREAGIVGAGLARGTAALPSIGAAYANTPATMADAATKAIGMDATPRNAAGQALPTDTGPYKPTLADFVHPDKWPQAAEYFAEKAGAAAPATPGERILSKTAEAVPSAVLSPEAPIAGAVGAALGGAASQTTAEAGGSPTAQTMAGLLAAGSLPALAATAGGAALRGAVRGSSGADMGAAADTAAANGTSLTVGQASGNKAIQKLETISGSVPGGGPIAAKGVQQSTAIGSNVSDMVDRLNSGGATLTPTGAGQAIEKGVTGAKASMRQAEQQAYDKVDALIPPNTPIPVTKTIAKLNELTDQIPGAEESSQLLVAPLINRWRAAILNDSRSVVGNPEVSPSTSSVALDPESWGVTASPPPTVNATTGAAGGTMPYSAVTALRTKLGNAAFSEGFNPKNPVATRALQDIWGSMTEDLNSGASAVSPQARAAVGNARSLYQTNKAARDILNTVVDQNGGPEAIYNAATSGMKNGATRIGGVMSALDPQSQNVVRATILDRLGSLPAGAQNAGEFDANTFLTGWGKIAPEAKDALFGKAGTSASLRSGLDSLASTIGTIRNAKALPNPSGSGAVVAHAIGLMGMLGEGATLVATGHPVAAAGVVGGQLAAIGANNLAARVLTNPKTVQWLARTTKLPTSALPNAYNQLEQMGQKDKDAADLAATLKQQGVAQ